VECHLGENIGQTNELAVLLGKSALSAGGTAAGHDVGGEYAVLMMAVGRRTPIKPAFPHLLKAPKP
jgi:hypothetical protein